MRVPDEVATMLRLRALGWGTRRIAGELGCDRETVQRYLAAGGWARLALRQLDELPTGMAPAECQGDAAVGRASVL
jgi:hypothetical protein